MTQVALPDAPLTLGAQIEVRAEHPDPDSVRRLLASLEVSLAIDAGPVPALIAVLQTPAGVIELR